MTRDIILVGYSVVRGLRRAACTCSSIMSARSPVTCHGTYAYLFMSILYCDLTRARSAGLGAREACEWHPRRIALD